MFYSQWREVVDLIINYPDLYYKGFYTFHKAIKFARHEIGPNYHVSHLINPLNNASTSSSSSSSIQFCNHYEVMTHTVKKLNETRYHSDNEVYACRQRIFALESANVELIRQPTLQNKSHTLDTNIVVDRINKQ